VPALRLAYRSPFAAEPLFRFLGDRAIPGVETFDGATLRRSIRLHDGSAAVIRLTPRVARPHVTLRVDLDDPTDVRSAADAARRLLDLDADPIAIDDVLGKDPALRPLVRARPGVRLPGAVDGFELAARAVLGQQVSVRAARTMAGRLVAVAGTGMPSEERMDGITHLFPSAIQVASASLDGLGLTGRRAATLRHLSERVAGGDLDLSGSGDREVVVDGLLAIPGVGPWTAAYVSMRALRDLDGFPATDLGIRAGMAELGLPTTPSAILARAERWRPWRGYAAMHLWMGVLQPDGPRP
jgi:AraC family transcriptional regulator of adaptative response / DNA-3-methyladenine glycosylase II